jgi:hypothetical protein
METCSANVDAILCASGLLFFFFFLRFVAFASSPTQSLTDLSLSDFRAALDAKKQKMEHASAAPDTPPAVVEAVAN